MYTIFNLSMWDKSSQQLHRYIVINPESWAQNRVYVYIVNSKEEDHENKGTLREK